MRRFIIQSVCIPSRLQHKKILPNFFLFKSHFKGSKGQCQWIAFKMGPKFKEEESTTFTHNSIHIRIKLTLESIYFCGFKLFWKCLDSRTQNWLGKKCSIFWINLFIPRIAVNRSTSLYSVSVHIILRLYKINKALQSYVKRTATYISYRCNRNFLLSAVFYGKQTY